MKRHFNIRLVSVATFLVMAVIITGCSSNKGAANVTSDNVATSKATTNNSGQEETVKESFQSNKLRIWYAVEYSDYTGKDSKIDAFYVVDSGKVTAYKKGELDKEFTLGDMSKMKDEEIVTTLQKSYLAQKNSNVSDAEALIKDDVFSGDYIVTVPGTAAASTVIDLFTQGKIISGSDANALSNKIGKLGNNNWTLVEHYNFSAVKDKFQKYVDDLNAWKAAPPEATSAEFAFFTDSTGNAVQSETIRITSVLRSAPSVDLAYIKTDGGYYEFKSFSLQPKSIAMDGSKLNASFELSGLTEDSKESKITQLIQIYRKFYDDKKLTVYDSEYSGYGCAKNEILLCRTTGNTDFVLDPMKTDGIQIDPSSGFGK